MQDVVAHDLLDEPKVLVECGSGSTMWIGRALRRVGEERLISLENSIPSGDLGRGDAMLVRGTVVRTAGTQLGRVGRHLRLAWLVFVVFLAQRLLTVAYVGGSIPNLTLLECTVNGQPGLVAQQDSVTVMVMAFDIAGDRIKHIWAVRNPEKLRPWTAG